MSLRGIRGATTATSNTEADILSETKTLLAEMLKKNKLQSEDIASIFFSVTHDLNAQFPAVAARHMGLVDVPLLCLNEINVPESVQKCIRILIHVNTPTLQKDIHHIYLNDATALRPDKATQGT